MSKRKSIGDYAWIEWINCGEITSKWDSVIRKVIAEHERRKRAKVKKVKK